MGRADSHDNRRRWAWILLRWGLWGVAGLVATALVFIATKRGIGTEGDSVTYYMAARTLLDGKGLLQQDFDGAMMPLSQFPPGYPVMLAAGGTVTGDLLKGAKYLNLIVAFASVWLSAYITHRFTRSVLISLVVAFWFGTHGHFIWIHARMFSEPAYICMTLAMVAILIRHGPRGHALWIAGILAGLATLTRFVGLYMIATCVLWIALSNLRYGWRVALARVFLFAAPAGALVGAWIVRNKLVSDAATSRIARFHPPPMDWITNGIELFKWWVIPVEYKTLQKWLYPWPAYAVWGAGIVMWFLKGARLFSGRSGRLALPAMLLIFYFPFVLTARTFMDQAIPSNNRMLVPVLVFSLIVAWSWLYKRWKQMRRRYAMIADRVAGATLALVFCLLVAEFDAGRTLSRNYATTGIGYQTAAWRNSPTVALIKSLPADVPVYTNAHDVVYLMTDRIVSTVPRSRKQPDGSYKVRSNEAQAVVDAIQEERALVVYFDAIKRDSLFASKELLQRQRTKPRIGEIYRFRDAAVLGIPGEPLPPYLPTTRPTTRPTTVPTTRPAQTPAGARKSVSPGT